MDAGEHILYLKLCLSLSILFIISLCVSGPFLIWGKDVLLLVAPSLIPYGLQFKSKIYPLPPSISI